MTERACVECGGPLPDARPNRTLCSRRCRNRRDRRHEVATGAYKASKARHKQRHPEAYTYESRRAAHRRHDLKRNAAKRGASIEGGDFTIADLIERDGLDCSLCGTPIDPTLTWPHLYSLTLDHVTPIALGGTHHPDNAALAHLTCNSRKGARVG